MLVRMIRNSALAWRIAGAGVLACALASISAARVAPDPLPSWDDLTTARTAQQLVLVDDLRYQFWTMAEREAYVWDIAMAKLPDGRVVLLRAEFQFEDGTYGAFDHASAEFPRDTVQIFTLAEVLPKSPKLWWANDAGAVHVLSLDTGGPGGGGTSPPVFTDPNERCSIRATFQCLPFSCRTSCRLVPMCECERFRDGAHAGTCAPVIYEAGCTGKCPTGKRCARTGGMESGCGCE